MALSKSEQEIIIAIREVQDNGFGSVEVKIKDGRIVHSDKTIGSKH